MMNGAVLDPDNVCPNCQSSAFELPFGRRSEAPVHCGHCQASLGSWGAFRRRVGTIEQREDGLYVSPGGPAADLIAGLRPGPYRDLYEAMDAIAFKTGGACEKSRS